MIGLVGMANRVTVTGNRGNVWAALLALLVGAAMALMPPPPLPIDGRVVLRSLEAPWGGAKLPDPQAQTRNSLAAGTLPSPRGKPASSPWPEPETKGLAAVVAPRPDTRGVVVRLSPAAVAVMPLGRRLAYDPHGPPFLTR